MGRIEDNYKNLKQLSEDTQERGRCRNFGISEKSSYDLGNIAIILADISESLAIIAEHYETGVEQEPFMNKPCCIANQVCHEDKVKVLDKIRYELHATAEMREDGDYYLHVDWIDEIFDKYKSESEVEE